MKIFNENESAPNATAVALGCFDGIHKGHMTVIRGAVDCRSKNLTPAVFTFDDNPTALLNGKKIPKLITTEQKRSLLEQAGVEYLFPADFNSVKDMSPGQFVSDILKDKLKAKRVFCGFNYHFGANAEGDCETLRRLCEKADIEVIAAPPVMFKEEPISSTRIRHALKQGQIKDVTTMLGREFSFKLMVEKGNQLGRRIGTPTFNQPMPVQLILPRFGVYASAVTTENGIACGVTNIGIKPTVGSDAPLAETWMPEVHCGDLYGKVIEVKLIDFIRPETKFNSIIELKAAILSDGEAALKIFKAHTTVSKMN